ncbi:MAG: threonine-phosphate decarboxylase [Alphaproteobacteria bacterium]|nr:threonine-phosphate decarboxylase [Alphaproteobacteria bacterium]
MIPHGGNLAEAARAYGAPAAGWLDLSTGINAVPYPVPALPDRVWRALPQADAEGRLCDAARSAYGVAPQAGVVAAPGTQALIQLLPLLIEAGPVAILSPTYGEHAHVWRRSGCPVRPVTGLLETGDARVIVAVNPNNPDGSRREPEALLAATAGMRAAGGLLVVDEAFADVVPGISLAGAAAEPGLVVLRSFGKFFGLAGLRLGFALGPPVLADRLQAMLGPWAVSGPALHIGAAALADHAWIEAARRDLARRAGRLDRMLAAAGLSVAGGTTLFRLVESDQAAAVHDHLARAGIWTRRFHDHPRRLRFGVPGSDRDFERVEQALRTGPGAAGA